MLIREKVQQAVAILNEFQIDCWITFARESALNGDPVLDYLLDSEITWHTAVIITRKGERIAIVGEYDRKSVEDLGAYSEVIGYVKGISEPFDRVMRALNPSTIALNYSCESEICDGITHGMYLTMMEFLGKLGYADRVKPADSIISALRQRKTPEELENIRGAIRATEKIFSRVAEFIKPGKTEREIAGFMTAEMNAMGLAAAWHPSSCPAVYTGPEAAAAHYAPTDRKVEPGHILNMDFGVRYNAYCSDLQRTFYVMKKGEDAPPAEVVRGFSTIVHAIEASRKAMKPGVRGIDIDSVARAAISHAGYNDFPHALGHQVGRFAHDGTALLGPAWEKYAGKPYLPLETGMVFTIEPRLTVAGRGVATIEEMVVVTEAGAEFISTPQQDLLLVTY